MLHCYLDQAGLPPRTWRETFPMGKVLPISKIAGLKAGEPVVFWCRCRAGEPLAKSLASIPFEPWQLAVVMADEPDENLVADALALGASGCCNTHASPEVLRQVALVVENGGLWVGQTLLRRFVGGVSRSLQGQRERKPRVDWSSVLSDREVQVARLVANGASNREVADQLSITERTVKAHMTAIFEKLGLRDRLQLSLRINGVRIAEPVGSDQV